MALSVAQELKDDRLGFDAKIVGTAGLGPLYTKNGGSAGGASRSMIYPGDVQVFITRNSTGNPRRNQQRGDARRRLGSRAAMREPPRPANQPAKPDRRPANRF